MKRRKPITATETMKELENDPEYQARTAERKRLIANRERFDEKAESKLVKELNHAGIAVESAWDLVNTNEPYYEAIPILVKHLSHDYPTRVSEGIVRALTVRAARGRAGNALVHMFKSTDDPDLRWVIGNALSVVADVSQVKMIEALLTDYSYGSSRNMLVHALARLRGSEAISILSRSLGDQSVAVQAIIALGNLRATQAKGQIMAFLKHEDSWVRDKVKRALKKIEKASMLDSNSEGAT